MTIIAFRSGILASDSCVTDGGISHGSAQKITRVRGGGLAGAAGGILSVSMFLDWASGGFLPDMDPDEIEKDCWGIRIKRNGSAWFFDESSTPYRVDAPFHAVGSGSTAALAAMHAGASAIEAVEIACKLVQGCEPPVVSLSMKVN